MRAANSGLKKIYTSVTLDEAEENWDLGRLSKDYEISLSSAEAMVKISHFHTLLKRL